MAGNSEVLKEYLLALGFSVDSKSSKTFNTTVAGFDAKVVSLAKGVTALGAAALGMSVVFARSMESLYYSSRRAESTAGNLKAAAFGASQIGIGADAMQKSIQGMASAMRTNPGLSGLLNSLGVKVEGRDKSDVMMDLVQALKGMPHYVGAQYASMFGISEDELLLMAEGLEKMRAAADLRKQMAKDAGLDMDAAAKSGMEYSNALKEITERVGILASVIGVKLLPSFREAATWTTNFLNDFTKIVGKITSWSDLWGMMKTGAMRVNNDVAKFMGLGPGNAAAPVPTPAIAPAALPAGNKNLPLGLRNNNPGNLRSWGSTPTSGGFAQFGSSQDGLSAMAGNLLAYQRQGLTSIDKIINRWAPKSENDTKAYVASIAKQTGYGSDDLLNMNDPKVLAALMSSMIKHENGYNPYSMNDINSAIGQRMGKGGVSMHQQTTINVNSPDPSSAAAQVASKQNGVNASIVRNLNTVVQ